VVERYGSRDAVAYTLQHVQPDRRRLVIDGFTGLGKPLFLSEFGGIAMMTPGGEQGWGYSVAKDGKELLARYQQQMAAIHACRPLSGFCYTQLADTFLEKNGLLTEDRVPKAPVEALAKATRGPDAHLHDWHLDPLGHARRWLTRRGPDFPVEWTRVGDIAEVISYPGEREALAVPGTAGPGSADFNPDEPPVDPSAGGSAGGSAAGPAGPTGFERRGRGAAGARTRRKAA
jgi:hypothetical protein